MENDLKKFSDEQRALINEIIEFINKKEVNLDITNNNNKKISCVINFKDSSCVGLSFSGDNAD